MILFESKDGATRLKFERVFSSPDVSPYDQIEWERRTAQITNAKGEVIFEQKDVEVPKGWSQTATNIVVSKYFHGKLGTPSRETSIRQMVNRVVETIAGSAEFQGYFDTIEDADVFRDELAYLLLNQYASFNSPVWFNVGCDRLEPESEASNWHWDWTREKVVQEKTGYERPQSSACFINSIEDSMEGIMRLATIEAMLFKFGSGTGTNFSPLRSSLEHVSGGGHASGPLSFMKGLDAFAGVIKSGGKTRRAAKMAILNVDHPDIEDFIDCKLREEKKAYALMREGYDGTSGPDSEAYQSIFYQNANNSVRVSNDFMLCVDQLNDELTWELKAVKDGRVVKHVKAHELMRKIAEATHECGDPGMQFDTTINEWHTCPNSARINASNPCSEYMFIDDSACNLASLNLVRFLKPNGRFNIDGFRHAVDVFIFAQDVLVDLSGYPTGLIAEHSHDFRPLGLGYANLGALLMSLGLPYDSDAGRTYAACITSLMTAEAYLMSGNLAAVMEVLKPASALVKNGELDSPPKTGAAPGWFLNREPFLKVIAKHWNAHRVITAAKEVPQELRDAGESAWAEGHNRGQNFGYRNCQVTVLAPTGTIGFMMDCDTTGIEPELSLIKYKKLVGGGMLKIVNETVERSLSKLGYRGDLKASILAYIDEHGMVEGCTSLAPEHLPIFDTSFKPGDGTRSIHYMGHVKMMAAVQPFLSGAISKTINMPENATVEDIWEAYVQSWKLGLKAVAIYRDGSKKNQVLVTKKDEGTGDLKEVENLDAPPKAVRHRLPDERPALIHKFSIANHDGYLTVGLYKNGQPGELFITMAKEGSTISGLMDAFALVVSVALQHGVPLPTIIDKLAHTRFEPSGWTKNSDIGYAKSIMDYIARWLQIRFVNPQQQALFPQDASLVPASGPAVPTNAAEGLSGIMEFGDSPSCPECGAIMVRNGSCYKCMECGGTSGCS